ncbi:MAG TPA: CapA family protein [Thermoanaerobaculia bacterium]|nr:CapA family protein [Thermoanaerobaculia bacterium]
MGGEDGMDRMDRRSFLKAVTGAAALAATSQVPRAAAEEPVPTPPSSTGRLTLAAVGDCILTRRVSTSRDPDFLALREILLGTDCAWGNCELVIADSRRVYPMPKGVDPHSMGPPWVADELAAAGIDFVGVANNHVLDFGYDGLALTLEHLDRIGIPHAGAGADLANAARPAYFDSPAGRVGQVNCASTFPGYFAASPAHPYLRGRPGLNPLSLQYSLQVDRDLFKRLKKVEPVVLDLLGLDEFEGMEEMVLGKADPDKGFFMDMPFSAGDRIDILTPPNPGDVTRITEALKVARNSSQVVLATIHAHEARDRLELPDPFVQPFARACVDAGADAFLLAGPHVLRGVEIYKGKPIFYSLGNFFFQHETIEPMPAEAFAAYGLPPDTLDATRIGDRITPYTSQRRFWESFVPVVTYEGREAAAIEIHPIGLGYGRPLYERGIPALARGEDARRILEKVAELSRPYGTRMIIDGEVGRIDPRSTAA